MQGEPSPAPGKPGARDALADVLHEATAKGEIPPSRCPHCDQEVQPLARADSPFLECPRCQGQFILAGDSAAEDQAAREDLEEDLRRKRARMRDAPPEFQGQAGEPIAAEMVEESPAEPQPEAGEGAAAPDELDAVRIKQVAQARRAAVRSRSYLIIGAALCFAAAGQLIWAAVMRIRHGGMDMTANGYELFTIAFLWGGIHLVGRIRAANRELSRTKVVEPTKPPEFSSLSDGSQRTKNLDNIK